jgi:hypothetical protein
MKYSFFVIFILAFVNSSFAQISNDDSANNNNVTINKDPRLDILAKKETEFNQAAALNVKAARGYRLMLLNTSDRALAIRLRSLLLQHFPEQKVYMSFQPPYIKVKFGDFAEKADADDYKTKIADAKLVPGNIYIVPDIIEVKPDKSKENTTNQPAN